MMSKSCVANCLLFSELKNECDLCEEPRPEGDTHLQDRGLTLLTGCLSLLADLFRVCFRCRRTIRLTPGFSTRIVATAPLPSPASGGIRSFDIVSSHSSWKNASF